MVMLPLLTIYSFTQTSTPSWIPQCPFNSPALSLLHAPPHHLPLNHLQNVTHGLLLLLPLPVVWCRELHVVWNNFLSSSDKTLHLLPFWWRCTILTTTYLLMTLSSEFDVNTWAFGSKSDENSPLNIPWVVHTQCDQNWTWCLVTLSFSYSMNNVLDGITINSVNQARNLENPKLGGISKLLALLPLSSTSKQP